MLKENSASSRTERIRRNVAKKARMDLLWPELLSSKP